MKLKICFCILLIGFLVYGFFVPVDTGLTNDSLIPEETPVALTEEESPEDPQELDDSAAQEESVEDTPKPEIDLASLSPEEQEAYAWTQLHENADSILVTREQIQNLNATIVQNCSSVVDILDVPQTMTAATILGYIQDMPVPELPKYNDGAAITEKELEAILDNENLDGDVAALSLGIVTNRTDLRALPTDTAFYTSADDLYYDQLQIAALYCSMPVWILHTSTDGEWVFVQSYFGRGWIRATDAATASSQDVWLSFADPENKIVITASRIAIKNTVIDMGCVFSCIEENGSEYTILLPTRDTDGMLTGYEASVSYEDAHNGYLDYSWSNFYVQLFRYLGTDYGWGDADGGVDASSLPGFVFRSFGILLPRDLADQGGSVGASLSLSDLSQEEIFATLDALQLPALLYKNGQVSVYLGTMDDAYYEVYAPRAAETVTYEEITDADRLISVNVIG